MVHLSFSLSKDLFPMFLISKIFRVLYSTDKRHVMKSYDVENFVIPVWKVRDFSYPSREIVRKDIASRLSGG